MSISPFTQSKRFFILAGLIAAAALGYTLWAHKTKAPSSPPQTVHKASLSVETIHPDHQDWPLQVTLNGAIYAWQEAQVSAEIGGLRIKQVLADVGSEVKRGQDLVVLESETVVADLHKQQATVARDRANLAEAVANAERARQIKDSGALSSQQINQYLITEEAARATLALSEAELENQQIHLRQTHVTAADDGIISARNANLGNVVAAGAELFRLIRQSRVEWRGEANAQQLTQIKKGQSVSLILPDNRRITGHVRLTAPTLDANTRNALVYVDLPKNAVQPGVYAQGTIAVGKQTALTVPQTCLVLRDGRTYVFEVAETAPNNLQATQVTQRAVITGRRLGDKVEITNGLTGNPELVATGGAFLNDGDWVNVVKQEKKPTPSTGAAQ